MGAVHPHVPRWLRPATNTLMNFVFMSLGATMPVSLIELMLRSVHMLYSVTSDFGDLTDIVVSVTCNRGSIVQEDICENRGISV